MSTRFFLLAMLVGLMVGACGPLPEAVGQAIAETQAGWTPVPTSLVEVVAQEMPPTQTPEPTLTLEGVVTTEDGKETGTVVKVVDGDTIDVSINGQIYRVRYIGMNTPESNEPCGNDATVANVNLVSGQTVTLVKDISETDRFDRLLRYVYVGDIFVNAELVAQGYAEAARYPPDIAHAEFFEGLEAQAAAANIACWTTGVFDDTGGGGEGFTPTSVPVSTSPPAATSPPASVCDCSGNLYSCSDFNTHNEAQACYAYCIGVVGSDVHRLDGSDTDGLACEGLP